MTGFFYRRLKGHAILILPKFFRLMIRHFSSCKRFFLSYAHPVLVRLVGLAIFSFFSIFLFPSLVLAAASDYMGSVIAISAPSRLEVGKTSLVTVTLKNTGVATWKAAGASYTSLYHWDPVRKMETSSPFSTANWGTAKQPFKIDRDVMPGESLTFSFSIKAPVVAGQYKEPFILTAENAAWIKQTAFILDLTVTGSQNALTSAPLVVSSAPVASPASNSTEWAGEVVDKGGLEWQIETEDHGMVELAFKNTGSKTWTREGTSFISLYAVDPVLQKERQSVFKDQRWLSASHPGALREVMVRTGEIGHVRFDLRAPKTGGTYKESFMLAAENVAWLSGTRVTLPIRVPSRGEFVATAPPDDASTPVAPPSPSPSTRPSGSYQALLLLRSGSSATLLGNGSQEFTFGFKNTGSSSWSSRGMSFSSLNPPKTGKAYSVRDPAWISATELASVSGTTKPGEIGFITFRVKAPSLKGSYSVRLRFMADGGDVEGGDVEIPVTVTQDGYVEPDPTPAPSAPSVQPSPSLPPLNAVPLTGDMSTLADEPIIRVGLFKTTDDQMVIRAKYVPVLVSQNGTLFCRLNTGEVATVHFDRVNKVYIISGAGCNGQSTNYFVFRAEDGISPMEIADFSRPLSWLPGANDNTFRAQLELRYTPSTNNVWVINTLPIEYYLKGIAETSNSSPAEFQRTLLVAARTYAMYHVQRSTKHADEFYTVDATYDQVYRGYGAEERDGNVVAAIDATRGQIVTYNSQLAITPYYSRSDGRTRAWGEVWYGGSRYPWLVSVSVPWDQGKTLWGHGVGMSASGALGMAREGKGYNEILTYFYPGTEIRRAYK